MDLLGAGRHARQLRQDLLIYDCARCSGIYEAAHGYGRRNLLASLLQGLLARPAHANQGVEDRSVLRQLDGYVGHGPDRSRL